MTTVINLTEDEFNETYSLLPNHLNPRASWTFGDGPGCLFETYGEELDFVRRQDPKTIWTVLDGADDNMVVQSGYHFVNRIGYLISTSPIKTDQLIQFRIPMNSESE